MMVKPLVFVLILLAHHAFADDYEPAESVDGWCEDEGLVDITNEDECRTACKAQWQVGNGKEKRNNFVGEWEFKGPQCFVAVSGNYEGNCHWNTKTDGNQAGGLNRAVCKIPAKYVAAESVDGWCEDEDLVDITNEDECKTACGAVEGWKVGNGEEKEEKNNFVGEWKFKGPQCFVAVVGRWKGNCHWNTKTDGNQAGRRNRAVCKEP